jgi:hypothetical protein
MGQIMNSKRITDLQLAVKERARMYVSATKLTLTGDEFVAAFIRPEHVNKLREVRELTGSIGNRYYQSCSYRQNVSEGVSRAGIITLNFQGNPPIIIPNYVESEGIISTAPSDTLDKIAAYVTERNRVGHLFGLAYDIIHWLANNCKDMRAARTLFPAITVLMKDAYPKADMGGYRQAERLLQSPASDNLPMLSRMVKNRFIEASQLIIATTLLPSEVSQPRDAVIIDFDGFNEECLIFSNRQGRYI